MRSSRNDRRFSWGASVRELILITLGIYLAFALNNWGESRKEGKLEAFYLGNLQTDVDRNIVQLERHLRLDSSQLSGARTLDGLLAQGRRADRDSLRNYLNSFNTNPRFRMNNYSYQSLLQSGDYRIITSDSLRNQLDHFFLELLEGVITTESYYLNRLDEHYYPVKESVYVARSDEFINIDRLFDPVFKDNVYTLPAYILQEMRHLKVTLDAAYALKDHIQQQLK
ncbi:MAG: hypothetical protein HEP71_19720 [Roseivirga sp.]|nr:hypothetical protein [Roseivirga sp.]